MAISSDTRESYGLAEITEVPVSEHECMAKLFVHNVWFGGIHRLSMVPNLLSTVEHTEG